MIDTAFIGATCPIGQYWTSKRYYDYIIDEENLNLMRGKEFGQVVIICPSLWQGPIVTREQVEWDTKFTETLINLLTEVKAERVTFVTGLDLLEANGNEETPQLMESDDPYLANRIALRDFINIRFGRVLNVRVPELVEIDGLFSVLDVITKTPKTKKILPVSLLERHQLYPMTRIVNDVEKAWSCSLSSVNLVTEPMTTYEIVEKYFPALSKKLPIARELDPYGSARTSLYSKQYHDPDTGYIMSKNDLKIEV